MNLYYEILIIVLSLFFSAVTSAFQLLTCKLCLQFWGLRMRKFMWNRFPIKNLLIDSLLTLIVESTYKHLGQTWKCDWKVCLLSSVTNGWNDVKKVSKAAWGRQCWQCTNKAFRSFVRDLRTGCGSNTSPDFTSPGADRQRLVLCVKQNFLDIWLSVLCVAARIFAFAGVCFETVVIEAPHGIVRCAQRLLLCRRTRRWRVISAARKSMWRVLLVFRVTPLLWRVDCHTRQAGLHFMHLCLQNSERFFGSVEVIGIELKKKQS